MVVFKKNVFLFFLILLFGACESNIPNLEIESDSQLITKKEGLVYYQLKPFSGFLIEKYLNHRIASRAGYLDGKLEGKQQKWYANGSKMQIRFYNKNRKVGQHNTWWPNGRMKFEYFIEHDIPIKTHREWYSNGQLYSVFNYNLDGQPEGSQQIWFENGQIKANYVIKNGRRFGFLGAKGCMGENEKKQSGFKLIKN